MQIFFQRACLFTKLVASKTLSPHQEMPIKMQNNQHNVLHKGFLFKLFPSFYNRITDGNSNMQRVMSNE
jgi:hypothetical protein